MGPAVTFEPRHSQPFTLEQAMQLEVDILAAEISRLENSIRHLQRTQDELRAYLIEEPEEDNGEGELTKAVAENEVVISSQRERITLIKIALLNKVGEGGAKHYGLDTGPLQPPKSDPPASTSNDTSEDGLHL